LLAASFSTCLRYLTFCAFVVMVAAFFLRGHQLIHAIIAIGHEIYLVFFLFALFFTFGFLARQGSSTADPAESLPTPALRKSETSVSRDRLALFRSPFLRTIGALLFLADETSPRRLAPKTAAEASESASCLSIRIVPGLLPRAGTQDPLFYEINRFRGVAVA
jgi:hypothetical protein